MNPTPGPASPGAQPADTWYARLAFHLLHERGPWRITLWLVLVIGALVAIAVFAGPWALAAVGALTAGGTAVARHAGGRTPEAPPDPALDPPPERRGAPPDHRGRPSAVLRELLRVVRVLAPAAAPGEDRARTDGDATDQPTAEVADVRREEPPRWRRPR